MLIVLTAGCAGRKRVSRRVGGLACYATGADVMGTRATSCPGPWAIPELRPAGCTQRGSADAYLSHHESL